LAEVQDIQREVGSIDKFIQDYRKYAGLTPEEDADLFGAKPEENIPARRGESNPRKEDLVPFIRELIQQRNKPLSRNTIFAALEGANIHLKGKDPKMILSTMLWRMPGQFVRLQGHGYWLAEKPYEPAGYTPSPAPVMVKRRV